jgi:alcohol dehydrogenase, propanol-preferring
MRAAVFHHGSHPPGNWLTVEDVPIPRPRSGEALLKVIACGVCRTDLHIVEGDLAPVRPCIVPGHQIVGEVIEGATPELPVGTRAGVSWIGGVDGDCWYCLHQMENLCEHPVFTGYTVDGGYAEYAAVRADFAYPVPGGLDAIHVAPLLCAGIIGFRSLRVAGVQRGERVGLFGYGSSATLTMQVLRAWDCEVYVATRNATRQQSAREAGATWVGEVDEKPPVPLDRAITFAPVGSVVVNALASLRKGGVVAINAIHLNQIPAFDYDTLLWGERQLRSVANMTRQDARNFLALARDIGLRPPVATFPLQEANRALAAVKHETERGSVVIVL